MAARAKIEFVQMTTGSPGNFVPGVITNFLSSAAPLSVSTTVTSAGSRPAAPASQNGQQVHARVTALDNPVIVAWGANPTASDTNGVRLAVGLPELIACNPGDLFSFLEVT